MTNPLLRNLTGQLRSQLAAIQNSLDELGRDLKIATEHGATVARDVQWISHSSKSISSALLAAYDEMEKLDALIAASGL